MHQVTREDVHHNRPVRQFHGKVFVYSKTTLFSRPLLSQKWPFVRLLGVQEPASVLFSLLNGAAVVVGYHRFSTSSPSDYHLHSVLHVELLVSTNLPSLHWLYDTLCLHRSLSILGYGLLSFTPEMLVGLRRWTTSVQPCSLCVAS